MGMLTSFAEIDTPRTRALPQYVQQRCQQHQWTDGLDRLQWKQRRIVHDQVHVDGDHHSDSGNYSRQTRVKSKQQSDAKYRLDATARRANIDS